MELATRTRAIGLAVGIVSFGLAGDRLLVRPPGVGLTVLALGGVSLFALSGGGRRWAWGVLAAAALLMTFATIRTAGWLVMLDALAAWTLGAIAMGYALAGQPTTDSLATLALRPIQPIRRLPDGLRLIVPIQRPREERSAHRLAMIGTAAASIAVAGVFIVVLAQADPVFAHVVTRPLDVGLQPDTVVHAVIAGIVALAAAALLATARRPVTVGPNDVGLPAVRPASWTAVLATTVGVFGLFLAVHLPAMYLGREQVLEAIGVTPASYAREGFVQMVVASLLTLALVGCMWITGGAPSRGARVAALLLLGMNLVILASAFHRLVSYEGAFGWTVARLLGHVGILWLAAVLVVTMVGIAVRELRAVPAAMLGLAFLALVGLNLINPDAFIASKNLARSGEPDVGYLGGLSEDAVPAIAAAVPGAEHPEHLIESIRGSGACDVRPAISFNLGHQRAARAAEPYC